MSDEALMREAIAQAKCALALGEMPVGCVIARGGEIVARAHNERETTRDPTAHAEILAIRRAASVDWRLTGMALYVTLEPCPMCAGAISQARLSRLVYGAADARAGCAGSIYRIPEDPAFSHFCKTEGGVLADECAALIEQFFKSRR
ncbi:MAG: nucleoside deaminase [Christensenellales bacterium]|jgi:tRNA(adenine34) deaminase